MLNGRSPLWQRVEIGIMCYLCWWCCFWWWLLFWQKKEVI
jgi:hypothetical protein